MITLIIMHNTTNIGAPTVPPRFDDHLGIRIDRETKAKLKQLAQRDRRTTSSYIQILLWDHVASETTEPQAEETLLPEEEEEG